MEVRVVLTRMMIWVKGSESLTMVVAVVGGEDEGEDEWETKG